jgi:hypothetical protein
LYRTGYHPCQLTARMMRFPRGSDLPPLTTLAFSEPC